jgi:GT2 family glycosyltransferase
VLVSVVVVNWNSREDLALCLASLTEQTCRSLEVIVVDNGSTDGSVELVRSQFPDYTLLEAGENLGFAEGCNRGIAAAHGEWIALLNNDAIADPRWAETLVEAAERAEPSCGMLQSTMFFLDRPGVINSVGLRLTRTGCGLDLLEGKSLPIVGVDQIFCPTGGAALYRRSMLEAIRLPVGYFDREYFMYSEDFDLGWRARLAGWTGQLVPDSIVRHRRQGSTARRGRAWFVVITRTNRLRTLVKNGSWRFLVTTLPHTVYETAELFWFGGFGALFKLPAAIGESIRQRRNVDRARGGNADDFRRHRQLELTRRSLGVPHFARAPDGRELRNRRRRQRLGRRLRGHGSAILSPSAADRSW